MKRKCYLHQKSNRQPISVRLLYFLCLFTSIQLYTSIDKSYGQSDGIPRGATTMPYVRYEADLGSFGNGAVKLGPSFDQKLVQSEATDRTCVSLNSNGSYVQWTLTQAGQGLVLRFSLPDAAGGGGISGTLALYVNGTKLQDIPISSKWSWQYFSPNTSDNYKDPPSNTPTSGWTPRMRFDEVRVKLPSSLPANTVIKLQKDNADGNNYVIDFIEMEPIPAAIAQPSGYLNVTAAPYNAVPDDNNDDFLAFNSCIADAYTESKGIYIPAGRYLLSQKLNLPNANLTIRGLVFGTLNCIGAVLLLQMAESMRLIPISIWQIFIWPQNVQPVRNIKL